ncbi:hypothetical protein RSOLAG1IB_08969 [Rhizoctonia solani AG-1 IB]|uniref:RBR-type E3 ubiquitin transferase n=1 Tax=Thanatephorus cucumeris (strain AG1-IB / isolate 7/3/14) TaxID=1108050 RepID=A0A0B7FLX9_THACB|nr:hypothetical protein RSOLAG1IB_08969 [Rhizoctonia solani AG-1 IB]
MTKLPDICLWSFDSPSEEAKHNVSTLDSADKAEDMRVHGESPLPSPPLSPNRSFTGGGNSASSDPDTEKDWVHHNVPSAREKSTKPSVSVPKGLLQKVRLTSTRATSSSPGQSKATDAVQLILRGERYNATFKGISQYTEGGSSACGLATLNATRLAFDLCLRRKDCEELISSLTSEEFVRAAMGIAGYWQNDMHLEVEHILQLPLFSQSVQVMSDQYAECTYRTFANAIRSLRLDPDSPGPRALCVTRPPEVIGVIHIPLLNSTSKPSTLQTSNSRTKSIYLVFDSHPRPNHPDGAAIQIFPSQSVADVANYLMSLFRVDQDIIDDPELEWTAQLLGQVSYHVLAPSSGSDTKDEYATNMRILEDARKRALAEEKLKAAEAETKKLKNQVLNQQQEISRLNITIRNLRTRETQSFGGSSSVFVDREDYDLAENLTCPMPKCTYKWCKQCSQNIESGAKHTCDGSAEFDHLMQEHGWKRCPGCHTPIERFIGCNHMTCKTPGCNMHFCYLCGAVIIDGGTNNEIQAAVTQHFRQNCLLFEVPAET